MNSRVPETTMLSPRGTHSRPSNAGRFVESPVVLGMSAVGSAILWAETSSNLWTRGIANEVRRSPSRQDLQTCETGGAEPTEDESSLPGRCVQIAA